ncbi:mitochondrial export translocase Oxa2, putative [Talaromyces stipitatus ATCC 10500]|uniref:Mitochondrial export translocase Oxa2, putative n=1 Tax=Talaromyces stipitatus (strain ATCC 10500 / CBS 375.48 / QM 6759 / NRRL 1006) TaxID=441959 RepID=B8LU09_TALSN|nr:mitochondrial export translocase Oxa2, putative [Talaromyces stipitatus ATCC 10500]EED23839.1 mitochondrial export translocase Oxa2, putative [Talaromyces stipitatus ATCC 10500]
MRPPLTPRWFQLRRPVTSSILFHRIRHFHATRPAPLVAESVTLASDFLHGVHGVTGLPWAASIPLAAVCVRMVVAFPLLVWSRVTNRKMADIAPLLLCLRNHYQQAVKAQAMENKLYMRPREAERQLRAHLKERTALLYKEWGISRTLGFLPLLQLPVWLALMEGVRNIGQSMNLPGVEPALANGGAFWFPDLLAGDTTGILPLALTLSIMANVRLGFTTKTFAELSDYKTPEMTRHLFLKVVKEFLTFMSVYIGFTAYMTGMPAGMMLYWIASTNTATLQSKFLDFLFASKRLQILPQMHVRVLKPGEKPPPIKSLE